MTEIGSIEDKRVLWDYLKFKIRQETISYSKGKARLRKSKLDEIEAQLKISEETCDNDPSSSNRSKLESLRIEHQKLLDIITEGSIIRSRINWYEKGEKNNKFFLNLENNNYKRNWVRKLVSKDKKIVTEPKAIRRELENFYRDVYSDDLQEDATSIEQFFGEISTPRLSDDSRMKCEGELTIGECFNSLGTFKNNKSPGNDGLTAEFY